MAKTPPSADNLETYIDEAFDKLEVNRLEGLEKARLFHATRLVQMENEAKRLLRRFGPEYNRVLKIESKIIDMKNTIAAIDMQVKFMKKDADVYDVNTWRVQGYVLQAGKPFQEVTIFIGGPEGKRGEWAAKPDETGFYSITLEKEIIDQQKDKQLFLFASDAKNKIVFKSDGPLKPEAGTVDIEDIVINESRK